MEKQENLSQSKYAEHRVEVIKYDEDDDYKNAPPPINRSMGDWD